MQDNENHQRLVRLWGMIGNTLRIKNLVNVAKDEDKVKVIRRNVSQVWWILLSSQYVEGDL